eukprot:m.20305 g.20305  ORF g.20305 m.20305 type:complete len:92 (-) comp5237_c0_seq1:179-454(-)
MEKMDWSLILQNSLPLSLWLACEWTTVMFWEEWGKTWNTFRRMVGRRIGTNMPKESLRTDEDNSQRSMTNFYLLNVSFHLCGYYNNQLSAN